MRSYAMRKLMNRMASMLAIGCVLIALIPLVSILFEVISNGYQMLSWEFVSTRTTTGIGNAIVGTLMLVVYASAVGLPVGMLTGIYISEFGNNRLGNTIRFFNDVMANFPSIVIGLLVYAAVVVYLDIGFSVIAGAAALAIIMIPVVANTTEEALKMVPNSLREGALALGIPRWRTVMSIVLSNGRAGVITGALLACARAAGETAPLILTVLWSPFWSTSPMEPSAALPTLVYYYMMAPPMDVDVAAAKAWGAALVLISIVLSLNVGVRLLSMRRFGRRKRKVIGRWTARSSQKA